MTHSYKTKGTCSQRITFDINDGIVSNVCFQGGCNGNLQGISKLAEGKSAQELISILGGIRCGFKSTSCPDQLATALKKAIQ